MWERRPRGRHFEDPQLEIVWAAAQALEDAHKWVLLTELATRVAHDRNADAKNPGQRARAAITCLRDAADRLAHAPTLYEYRRLRVRLPELGLMSDAAVRRALGNGSWNECLAAARLQATRDGDFAGLAQGPRFTEDDLLIAVQEFIDERDFVPTLHEYLGWARLPEVAARPGHRPLSVKPFERYGGYRAVLERGELVSRKDTLGRTIPLRYRYTDDELLDALRGVAESLGFTPRRCDYSDFHTQLVEEARMHPERDVRVPPSAATIVDRFGPWPAALERAGLAPLDSTRKSRRPVKKRPDYSDQELLDALQAAWAAQGVPLTTAAYNCWRDGQLATAAKRGTYVAIPAVDTIVKRFGSWRTAIAAAIPSAD